MEKKTILSDKRGRDTNIARVYVDLESFNAHARRQRRRRGRVEGEDEDTDGWKEEEEKKKYEGEGGIGALSPRNPRTSIFARFQWLLSAKEL